MTVRKAIIIPVTDTTNDMASTFRLSLVDLPINEPEVWIHQITGNDYTLEEFEETWNQAPKDSYLLNFTSISLEDAEKLLDGLKEILEVKEGDG